jgi:hypothetical protein
MNISLREQDLTRNELKDHAFDLYLQGFSRQEICEKCNGLPLGTLKGWIQKHNWADLKRETEEARYNNHAREVQQMLMDNRLRIMRQHLDLSDKLSDALMKKIDAAVDGKNVSFTARDLESVAKAMKNVTDVSARVVGLTEKGDSFNSPQGGTIVSGNIINIGTKPQPVHPIQEAQVEIVEEIDRPF